MEWTAEAEVEYVIQVPVRVKLADLFDDPDMLAEFCALSDEAQYMALRTPEAIEAAIAAADDKCAPYGFWQRLQSAMDDFEIDGLDMPPSLTWQQNSNWLRDRERAVREGRALWAPPKPREPVVWGAGRAGAGGVR